jgi:hypothetical protein
MLTPKDGSKAGKSGLPGMSAGTWIVLIVLLSLLVAACVFAYVGWTSESGFVVPTAGFVALTLGVLFSLVVGVGLMALVFYSSRKGYDEPATLMPSESDLDESKTRGAKK